MVVALDWMFWVGGNCIVIVVAVDCLVLDGCFGLLGSLDVVWFGLITFVCFWIAASSFCWIGSMSWISLCFVCIGQLCILFAVSWLVCYVVCGLVYSMVCIAYVMWC